LRATVTVEMVSEYCVLSYASDKLCIPSTVSGILWYYVKSVIMMEYTVSYREICYLVKRGCIRFALYTKLLTAAQHTSEYLFITLIFSSIK
jgi:hypothetical protein